MYPQWHQIPSLMLSNAPLCACSSYSERHAIRLFLDGNSSGVKRLQWFHPLLRLQSPVCPSIDLDSFFDSESLLCQWNVASSLHIRQGSPAVRCFLSSSTSVLSHRHVSKSQATLHMSLVASIVISYHGVSQLYPPMGCIWDHSGPEADCFKLLLWV